MKYQFRRWAIHALREIGIKKAGGRHVEKVRTNSIKIALFPAAAVLVVVSLAGFVTLARNAQYLPKSNPARYLSIASKMKVNSTTCVAPIELHPAQPNSLVRIPEPILVVAGLDQWQPLPVERIDISISLPNRAPPYSPL